MDDEGEHLNREAYFALSGARPDPERIIAALLASPHDIYPDLRARLADALLGRLRGGRPGITLKAVSASQNQHWLARYGRIQSIERGREMLALQAEGAGYEDAAEAVAEANNIGRKKVEAGATLMRRADAWVASKMQILDNQISDIRRESIEAYLLHKFIDAEIFKQDPNELLNLNAFVAREPEEGECEGEGKP